MGRATANAEVGRRSTLERVAALAGTASFVATFVGAPLGDMGGKGIDPTMGPDAIVRAVRPLVGELQVGASLLGLAAVLLVVFLGPLWRRLRMASEWIAVVGVGGGVLAATLYLTAARDLIAMATAAELGEGLTAQVLTTSGWDAARLLAVPFLTMVVAAVMAGLTHGVFPTWFRWFSTAMLVLLVAALAPVGPAGLLGILGTLWVLVASLVLAAEAGPH
jgi:hypothetical protein